MDFTIVPEVAYAIAWLAVVTGVYQLFEKFEDVCKTEFKEKISNLILNFKLSDVIKNIPIIFITFFDSIWGSKYFSFRFIIRSILASFLSIAVFAFIWAILNRESFSTLLDNSEIYIVILGFSYFGLLFNLVPDIVSLYETRFLMGKIKEDPKLIKIAIFLILDLVFTTFIALITMYFIITKFFNSMPPDNADWIQTLTYMLSLKSIEDGYISFGIFFYSTFFTSIWIWIYSVSLILLKAIQIFFKSYTGIIKVFEIKSKPIRSIGIITNLIITLGFLVLIFV